MNATTITLFLLKGEATSLRIAEIGNWTGKAIAAPRTELAELFQREELGRAGVYILSGGIDPVSGAPLAYIGEAENIYDRLKQHKTTEFWDSLIVFISKDESLNKAHVRYLENRLLTEATRIGRFKLEQNLSGGAKLREADRADMEDFLYRIRQLLPVLGSEILIPAAQPTAKPPTDRNYWETVRGTPTTVKLADKVFQMITDFVQNASLSYKKIFIGIRVNGRAFNFASFQPQKHAMLLWVCLPKSAELDEQLENSELDVLKYDKVNKLYGLKLKEPDINAHNKLLNDLLRKAYNLKKKA
jgi:hypothetical protein